MTDYILERHDRYLVIVSDQDLTEEFIEQIKKDKDDVLGWKKHRKALKEQGINIE